MMFELTTLVMIGTDCIGSCKPNYHTITTTAAPVLFGDVLTKCQRSFSLFLLFIILPVTAIKKYYLSFFKSCKFKNAKEQPIMTEYLSKR